MGLKCSKSSRLAIPAFWELPHQLAKQPRPKRPNPKASTGNKTTTKPSHKRSASLELAITLQSEQRPDLLRNADQKILGGFGLTILLSPL